MGYVREFFTNWREYDGPFSKKVRLTLRNRCWPVATAGESAGQERCERGDLNPHALSGTGS